MSLMFGSGLSLSAMRKDSSMGGVKTGSKSGLVRRVTNQPRAPEVVDIRARRRVMAYLYVCGFSGGRLDGGKKRGLHIIGTNCETSFGMIL